MTASNNLAIEVEGLSFDYHGTSALDKLDFTIQTGERVGIVGPNGAGKSTLLLHLNGLLHGAGILRIMGTEVNNKNGANIRRHVGLVFSDAEDQLFMPTLEQDAAFGPLNMGLSPSEALKRAIASLKQMRLEELRERSSHHLSDGERRRAAIATVLSMEPSIWVLDEPAANLDPRSRRDLIGILKNLSGTVVLASHDLDMVVQVCQRCLLLDNGRLIADGPTNQLLTDARLMEDHGLEVPLRLVCDPK
jgi:cobalt/nickel transport system ATP-binding protein